MFKSTRKTLTAAAGTALIALVVLPPTAASAQRRDMDCADFTSQKSAQIFFLKRGGPRVRPLTRGRLPQRPPPMPKARRRDRTGNLLITNQVLSQVELGGRGADDVASWMSRFASSAWKRVAS